MQSAPFAIPYTFQAVNNEAQGLYYEITSTVTLASGSTDVISGQSGLELGEVTTGGNAQFVSEQIADVTTYPSQDEIDQIAVTISRYKDSGYSHLYDQTTFTVNLHFYSDSNTNNSVVSTDNFSGPSSDSWANDPNEGNMQIATDSTYYYDATSGYSIYGHNIGTGSALWVAFPYNSSSNGNNIYKAFSPSSSLSDALLEYQSAGPNGMGRFRG